MMLILREKLQYASELMKQAQRIVALTGAGISTESGIPDFRSPGSIWLQQPPVRYQDFITKPEARQQYWRTRRDLYGQVSSAQPNAAHLALVDLAKKEHLLGIVTQNFDGLHHDAGNDPEQIVELHGTSRSAACTHCGQRSSMRELQSRIDAGEVNPLCSDCGGFLKAATILFGQRIPDDVIARAKELAFACDLFLVVGSSLKVNPAAILPRIALKNDVPLIIINLQPTHLDDYAEIVINEKAGEVLPQIVATV